MSVRQGLGNRLCRESPECKKEISVRASSRGQCHRLLGQGAESSRNGNRLSSLAIAHLFTERLAVRAHMREGDDL